MAESLIGRCPYRWDVASSDVLAVEMFAIVSEDPVDSWMALM